jgi:hypothetical protein
MIPRFPSTPSIVYVLPEFFFESFEKILRKFGLVRRVKGFVRAVSGNLLWIPAPLTKNIFFAAPHHKNMNMYKSLKRGGFEFNMEFQRLSS